METKTKKSQNCERKILFFLFRGRNELPHNSVVSGKPQLSAWLFLIGSVSLSRALSCLLPMDYWNILWWKAAVFLLSKRCIWMLNDTKTTRSMHNFPYNDKNNKKTFCLKKKKRIKVFKNKKPERNQVYVGSSWAGRLVWRGGLNLLPDQSKQRTTKLWGR